MHHCIYKVGSRIRQCVQNNEPQVSRGKNRPLERDEYQKLDMQELWTPRLTKMNVTGEIFAFRNHSADLKADVSRTPRL